MAPTTFDRTDLLDAHLSARRWTNAHPDLAGHHQARCDALAAAFGADIAATKGTGPLGGLLDRVIVALELATSPFAYYMEAPRSIAVLAKRHGPDIADAMGTTRLTLTALALDVIEQHWGLGPAVTVDDTDLRRLGFDPEGPAPDPDDFW